MAAQLTQIQKSGSNKGSGIGRVLGGIVGAVGGALTGGPGGAIAGASGGANLGGSIGGAIADKKASVGPSIQGTDNGSMQRRLQQLQNDDLIKLAEAKAALPELPQDLREQYQAPIDSAFQEIFKKRVG
jgi:hypothetical protein